MHPDALIAALHVELEEATDAEHAKAIKAEIERVDKLPRPVAKPEEPETVFDRRRAYIDALHVELKEAATDEHKAAIKAEIKRAESELAESDSDDSKDSDGDLEALTRKELDDKAEEAGVENPGELPNKDAVIAAIREASGD